MACISERGIMVNGMDITPDANFEELAHNDNFDVGIYEFDKLEKCAKMKGVHNIDGLNFRVTIVQGTNHLADFIKLTPVFENDRQESMKSYEICKNWIESEVGQQIEDNVYHTVSYAINSVIISLWISNTGTCHSIRIYKRKES